MTRYKLVSCLMLIVYAPIISYPQQQKSRENLEWEERHRQRQREDRADQEKRSKELNDSGNPRVVRSSSSARGPSYVSPSKLTDEQKKLLKPSPHDEASFARFLSRPNTGILRLLPREKYDQTILMPLRGGGAFYSFVKLSHEASRWSDIKFQDGKLYTGLDDLTLGLMTTLGDVSLEDIDSNNPAVKFIGQLVLPVKYAEYRGQAIKYQSGFEADGKVYRSALPAQLNTTYLLRSTIYNRTDTVIAFRLIRRDADGSVTLLWKMLNKLRLEKLKDVPREYREPSL